MGTVEQFPKKRKRKTTQVRAFEYHLRKALDGVNAPVCQFIVMGMERATFIECMSSCYDYWKRMSKKPPDSDDAA